MSLPQLSVPSHSPGKVTSHRLLNKADAERFFNDKYLIHKNYFLCLRRMLLNVGN